MITRHDKGLGADGSPADNRQRPARARRILLSAVAAAVVGGAAGLWLILAESRPPEAPAALLQPVDAPTDLASRPVPSSVVRSRYVSISPEALSRFAASGPEGDSERSSEPGASKMPTLRLFEDVSIVPEIQTRRIGRTGGDPPPLTLSGGVKSVRYSLAVFVVRGESLTATVNLPGARYRILPVSPPIHRIDEVSALDDGGIRILE